MSMTGQGAGRAERDGVTVAVEVRAVNNRYFKLSFRATDGFSSVESRVDEAVRKFIHRGTVQVEVRVERDPSPNDFRLNEAVLAGYQRQLQSVYGRLNSSNPVQLESLLQLPGVVTERGSAPADADTDWPMIERALHQALERLTAMRAAEGRAMAEDLLDRCGAIKAQLDGVEQRAPLVAENYRVRLTERLNRLLAEHGIHVQPADLVREVGLFAERCDISEEVVRLRSHLDQVQAAIEAADGGGRKLEFVTQEMFREANTIGSKANDSEICTRVVEIKTAIERMREMIQNVE